MGQAKQRASEINELKKTPKPARMGNIERKAIMREELTNALVNVFTTALSPPAHNPTPDNEN